MEQTASIADVIIILILSSFFIERGLAFIYETEYFLNNYGIDPNAKTTIAFLVSLIYAFLADINIVSISYDIVHEGKTVDDPLLRFENWFIDSIMVTTSFLITASVLAGGCKPFVTLFRDVWGVQNLRAKAVGKYAAKSPASFKNTVSKAASGNSKEQTDLYDLLDQAAQIKHKKRR